MTRCAARRVVTPTDGDRLQQASPRENLIKNKYFCSQLAHAVQQLTYACAAAPFSTAMARHACSRSILTILFYSCIKSENSLQPIQLSRFKHSCVRRGMRANSDGAGNFTRGACDGTTMREQYLHQSLQAAWWLTSSAHWHPGKISWKTSPLSHCGRRLIAPAALVPYVLPPFSH